MEIKWSKQQEAVIYHRNKNMLVSAAAGSGKTAVLVQRIISLLTDDDNPSDLDRMLVVTFTKAAAGEMKERVRIALNNMIANDGGNERLRRQAMLIHNARISTIHSFCSDIIKNYFYEIDIDPSFRIMEDGEQKLMMADCAKEVLEEAYGSDDRRALDFAVSYSIGKDSKKIQELIISAYNNISAQAWPKDWEKNALRWWNTCSVEELENLPEIRRTFDEAKDTVSELKKSAECNLKDALAPDGPSAYIKALEADIELLNYIAEAQTYNDMCQRLKESTFVNLGRSGKKGENEDLKNKIKNRRNTIKDETTALMAGMLVSDLNEIAAENKACKNHVEAFFSLLDDFTKCYSEKKRGKNLMDYGDLEHYALKILLERKEDGTVVRTAAAKEIADGLDYVMTDEYQDSNDIQELILWAVSGNDDGRNNRFMVGDIKQSIYGFRNARPEIFTDTYDRYSRDGKNSEVIDLHDNYRSASEVIKTLNYIFENVMSRKVGGVDYDDSQALHSGIAEDASRDVLPSELMLLEIKNEDGNNKKRAGDFMEAEAVMIANEIKHLKADGLQSRGDFEYGDCAVLVRTGKVAQEVCKILQREGVPAYTESRTGYFATVEVSTILSYINIIDNPLQDIPLAAVLFSPIVGCTTDELSQIRIDGGDGRLYKAVLQYMKNGSDSALKGKLSGFLSIYNELRAKASYTPIHKLLNEIYDKTGYRNYAAAMPGGSQRAANLDLLMQKAYAYEKTSYSGLFNFVRYIEELKKDDNDIGEAGIFSGNNNAVCIMTIHKSKGLEFPVVFLCGCAKRLNNKAYSEKILIHEKLGIGIDVADISSGKKKSTFYKKFIAGEMAKEDKSEELRVLYVALTRAKKKLYITASTDNLEKKIQNALDKKSTDGSKPSYGMLLSAISSLDIILLAFANHKMFEPLAHYVGIYDEHFNGEGDYVISRIVSEESLKREKNAEANRLAENLDMLPGSSSNQIFDEKLHALLKEVDSYTYPLDKNGEIPVKISVSDIKRLKMVSDDEQTGEKLEEESLPVPYIPEFMSETQKKGGAFKGTAYHKFWRYIDYSRLSGCSHDELHKNLIAMLEEIKDKKLLSESEADEININDFVSFVLSPIGERMARADAAGKLYRERPFTALMPAESLNPMWNGMDDVIVQGVIDAYFDEGDGYVLVDYKTDHVGDKMGDELIEKYRTQLIVYADALEKDLSKPIKEKVIYSAYLKKDIRI